jgi:maltose O-acetyltransferase
MLRKLCLFVYYAFAQHFPTQPVPSWKIGYAIRRFLVKRIFMQCGEEVIVKQHAYFGDGQTLSVGHHAQVGMNARIDRDVTIGDDVVMGPDVIIMTSAHAFEDPDIPINLQGAREPMPVRIGRDVWIGTRVIILPGVEIGEGSVIGAGSLVSRSIPPFSVAVGVPARVVRKRGDRLNIARDVTTLGNYR